MLLGRKLIVGVSFFIQLTSYHTAITFFINVFLAVDKFQLRSALFDGSHTPLVFAFLPFIPTRLDQVMYITQILEQKRRGIAFFILLVPYEQLKLIFFSPQVGLEQGIS